MIRWSMRLATTVAFCLFAGVVSGQNYPPDIPDAFIETYKTVDGVALNAWIVTPEAHDASHARPALVFFFGGGWSNGTPAQFERQARALVRQGMVAVLADYRVKSRHKTTPAHAVEDAKSAVRWVRQHAHRLGIDPLRIGAAGASAGGHLAAATATLSSFEGSEEDLAVSSVPNALVLFNPVTIVAPVPGEFELDKRLAAYFAGPLSDRSPYHHVDTDVPPTLILHGIDDELVPSATAEAFCSQVVDAGGDCQVLLYDGAGHGFFNRSPYYEETLKDLIDFLGVIGWLAPQRF